MSVPVFSTLLLARAVTGSSTTAFLVPTGFRCVLRRLDVFESAPGGAVVELAGNDGIVFWAAGPNLTSTFNTYSWDGRQVIDEGKQLEVSNSLDVNIYASGYLLTLP